MTSPTDAAVRAACVRCAGTGEHSSGDACSVCNGTGLAATPASPAADMRRFSASDAACYKYPDNPVARAAYMEGAADYGYTAPASPAAGERFDAVAFCRALAYAAVAAGDPLAAWPDFAARLKPHLADCRAVEGMREATKLLRGYHAVLRHKAISPSMNPGRQEELEAEVAAWLSVHTALAAAGEGE